MSNNKKKIDKFFDKYASEYSKENYDSIKNQFMSIRLETINNLIKNNFIDKNIRILDLGCGSGEITLSLAKLGYVGDGLDNSIKMINIAKEKLNNYDWNFFIGEAQNTKLQNNSYDLIIASGLIEYFSDDNILMVEIYRLLKQNGHLIINITNKYGYSTCLNSYSFYFKQNFFYKFLKSKLFGHNYGVVNFSTKKHNTKKFKNYLKNYNFEIKKEKYIGFSLFPSPFFSLFRFLTKKIDIKLENLSNTPLKYLGASFVILCKKN